MESDLSKESSMNHVDKVVRIREVRDYLIPIYDEVDDEVAKAKAMEMLERLPSMHCVKSRSIVGVDTKKWSEE